MEKLTVVSNAPIAERIYELTVKGPVVEKLQQPGQFVHIKAGEGSLHMLRRPDRFRFVISIKRNNNLQCYFVLKGKAQSVLLP